MYCALMALLYMIAGIVVATAARQHGVYGAGAVGERKWSGRLIDVDL